MFTKKNMIVIALIAIFVVGVINIFAGGIETYSYSYDSSTSIYTENIDDNTYMYEQFYTGNYALPAELKAISSQIGSGGWSVHCEGFGTDCWETVIDTKTKYEAL